MRQIVILELVDHLQVVELGRQVCTSNCKAQVAPYYT
jgi:hypothetical protein